MQKPSLQEFFDAAPQLCHHACSGEHLPPRVQEVWKLLAEGWNNPAIAQIMTIQVRTVEHHINILYSYLHLEEAHGCDKRVLAARIYEARAKDAQ